MASEMSRKKIAVIGAGASGLCALRHFVGDSNYEIIAFEQNGATGGVWNYPEGCETHTKDVPSSSPYYSRMYRDLRVNTPKDITHFPDFPHGPDVETFPTRQVIWQYLQNYAEHFDLRRYVKVRHEILSVNPIATEIPTQPRWSVTVRNLDDKSVTTDTFDVVLVCNGHYSKPYVPLLSGIANFAGPVIHSSEYRVPESYAEKRVLVIGGNISANELVCALLPLAKKVILCRKTQSKMYDERFPTLLETGPVQVFNEHAVVFQDGSVEPIDCVIFCTGYQFDFAFLNSIIDLEVSRGRLYPLYRHLIHCRYHTIAFVGLLIAVPFLAAGPEIQIRYYKAFLDGKLQLPSVEDMIQDTDADYEERMESGLASHQAHYMFMRAWPYFDQLGKDAGFVPYEKSTARMMKENLDSVRSMPFDFRNVRHERLNSETSVWQPLP